MRHSLAALVLLALSSSAVAQGVLRLSLDPSGGEADGDSGAPWQFHQRPVVFSADGRFVAFESYATDLVANDTNGALDIFVFDRTTGTIERVSVDSLGYEASDDCHAPVLSTDGRFVAFWSIASNLVVGDSNGVEDTFLRDRSTGITSRVSLNSSGIQGNSGSYRASLSADGQIVAFESNATNFVSGDTNACTDIFVRNRVAGTVVRVSVTDAGKEANWGGSFDPGISADGLVVVFSARASNLVPGDSNGNYDVFVRDLAANTTERASVDSAGVQGNSTSWHPVLSSDGLVVAFESYASNLVGNDTNGAGDIFVHDRATGVTERASVDSAGVEGNDGSLEAAISSDGRFVAFQSSASNFDPADANETADVFLRDRVAGTTTLASINAAWSTGDDASSCPAIPGDGAVVAFSSHATNLVGGDTNAVWDVFLYDPTIQSIDATWSNYGAGYPGTLGVPTLTSSADPVFGSTISIDVSNSYGKWTVGLLGIGLASDSILTNAGGTLLIDPLFFSLFPLPVAGMSFTETIPRDVDLNGISAYLQALELDLGAAHQISFTEGLQLVFGH